MSVRYYVDILIIIYFCIIMYFCSVFFCNVYDLTSTSIFMFDDPLKDALVFQRGEEMLGT